MAYGDEVFTAFTLWKEDRGGRAAGMDAVANAIANRVKRHNSSFYFECTDPNQFSSVTAKGDPELTEWAKEDDAQWIQAQRIAQQAVAGTLPDVIGGATLYYAPATVAREAHKTFQLPDGTVVPFPLKWNPVVVQFTVSIGGQLFFREL